MSRIIPSLAAAALLITAAGCSGAEPTKPQPTASFKPSPSAQRQSASPSASPSPTLEPTGGPQVVKLKDADVQFTVGPEYVLVYDGKPTPEASKKLQAQGIPESALTTMGQSFNVLGMNKSKVMMVLAKPSKDEATLKQLGESIKTKLCKEAPANVAPTTTAFGSGSITTCTVTKGTNKVRVAGLASPTPTGVLMVAVTSGTADPKTELEAINASLAGLT